MLKKVTRKSGGTVRERYLSALAEKSFIGLWSYPSVFRDQGLSTSGTGKEVADLLLYFDGHVVLFSDKDIAFPTHTDIKVAWGRWYKRSIVESAKQLYAAQKYIRANRNRLFLDEKCQHAFPAVGASVEVLTTSSFLIPDSWTVVGWPYGYKVSGFILCFMESELQKRLDLPISMFPMPAERNRYASTLPFSSLPACFGVRQRHRSVGTRTARPQSRPVRSTTRLP